ncbi:phosphoribosylglycinamide formyltransferase [Verrucomicrobiaceae bacterium 227]
MKKIAVFGSGAGSNFSALYEAFGSQIDLVVSDQKEAGLLKKAEALGIRTVYEKGGRDLCQRILPHLEGIDLICLAGFMRLVKEPLLSAFPRKILNIHPSLLPSYPGLFAWEQAVEDGATESGCTVHYVDTGMDTGEIILQATVPVLPKDTAKTLHARIQVEEHRIYPEAVRLVLGAGEGCASA